MERDGVAVKYVYVPKSERELRGERVVSTIIDYFYYYPGQFDGASNGLTVDGKIYGYVMSDVHLLNVVNQGPKYYERIGNEVSWDYLQLRVMFMSKLNRDLLPVSCCGVRVVVVWWKPRLTARSSDVNGNILIQNVDDDDNLGDLFSCMTYDGTVNEDRLPGLNPGLRDAAVVLLEENLTFNLSQPAASQRLTAWDGGVDPSSMNFPVRNMQFTGLFDTAGNVAISQGLSNGVVDVPTLMLKPDDYGSGGSWSTHDDARLYSRRVSLAGLKTTYHLSKSYLPPGPLNSLCIDQSGSLLCFFFYTVDVDVGRVINYPQLNVKGSAEVGFFDK